MLQVTHPNNDISLGMLDLKAFAEDHNISEKRKIEKEGIYYLLKHLLENDKFNLCYTPAGKPFLEGRQEHISISHSHDKLVILIHKRESAGVDIELIREKVKNVQHKFLNEKELAFTSGDTEKLITLWAAKESIYKAYGLKEVDFKTHMSIEPYGDAENNFFGKIDLPAFKRRYLLNRSKSDNYILVYTLGEV